jgi:hypothetical protein
MKNKVKSFVLGISLAILGLPPNSAFARSSSGFSSFHLQSATEPFAGYACVTENNGAVVNSCTHDVNLLFETPIDNTSTTHSITVQNYWGMKADTTFSCVAYAYTGTTGSSTSQVPFPTFTTGVQSFTESIYVGPAEYMQVICFHVPPGDGVASVTWAP